YLPSRLSQFYERAGDMIALCGKEGSVSVIGAVSPQGADFSEPVTQNTKRFVRCFWALDKSLAYARHYAAINWTTSYSEYVEDLSDWYAENVDRNFLKRRQEIMTLLQEESKLLEIVKLIGTDVLPDDQKLIIEIARVIRVGFLQQNAFHKDDTYVPLVKQLKMMEIILHLYHQTRALVVTGIPVRLVTETGVFEKLIKMKYDIPNDRLEMFDAYYTDIDSALSGVK
ncbi:MAG: V-type ATP synthase subunit A, partial [Acetanaerobacterium sp.]